MKNKNALTILLYVFAVLSLAYTCYAAIQAYNTFTSYYSTNLSVVNLVLYMITTCYESICFSVLFYALGVFSEMFKKKEEENSFILFLLFFVYQHIYLECCQLCSWIRFKYLERLIYSCNWFLIRPWHPWFFQLYYM